MKQRIKIIAYNEVLYRGVKIKVIPELILEMNSSAITEEEAINYFEKIYGRELQQMRIEKLNKLRI